MLKNVLHITDDALNYESLSDYSLLFQVGDQFLGCVLFHPADQTVVFLSLQEASGSKLTGEEIAAFLQEHAWLKRSFRQVYAVSYSLRHTLVHDALYDSSNPSFYPDLQFGIRNQELILAQTLEAEKVVSLLSVPQDVHAQLSEMYDAIEWSHWHAHQFRQQPGAEAKIHLSFFPHTFSMAVEKMEQWQLIQSYRYSAPEDVLYTLLSSFALLKTDASLCPVFVSGLVDENSALMQLLQQYIPHIKVENRLVFRYPQPAEPLPVHTFALTDRILTCVS